jgi:hypothetical protein
VIATTVVGVRRGVVAIALTRRRRDAKSASVIVTTLASI